MNDFLNQWHYSDMHEMNLDWIINTVKRLALEMKSYEAVNHIEYKGNWSITSQYPSWSIVTDGNRSFISKVPVPAGIELSNTDYWIFIGLFTVDTSLDTSSLNPIANKPVAEKFNTIDSSVSSLESSVSGLVSEVNDLNVALIQESGNRNNADLNLSERISDTNTALTAETNARTDADALLQSQIDQFVALQDGSTTGDAELQNIRIGDNGYTYDTAGDAVRGQYSELKWGMNQVLYKTVVASKVAPNSDHIPLFIPGGSSVTIRTVSGDNFTSATIYFFTKNRVEIDRFSLPSSFNNERTITLPATDCWSVRIVQNTGDPTNYYVINNSSIYAVASVTPNSFNLQGKTVVCFGDSLTGNFLPPYDYPSMIANLTGATVINMGVGGATMAYRDSHDRKEWSMVALTNAIINGDYSAQAASSLSINYVSDGANGWTDTGVDYIPARISALESLDLSAVDYVTIAYGTNDWANGNHVDNSLNPLDTTTYLGALRYCIENLLTAYPHLKILVISPAWRFDPGTPYKDSDTWQLYGNYLYELADGCLEVSKAYHLHPYDQYYECGFNKFNRMQYFYPTDGTHPKQAGRELMASKIANQLMFSAAR